MERRAVDSNRELISSLTVASVVQAVGLEGKGLGFRSTSHLAVLAVLAVFNRFSGSFRPVFACRKPNAF